jgi:hypothetical protein
MGLVAVKRNLNPGPRKALIKINPPLLEPVQKNPKTLKVHKTDLILN